MVDSKKQLKQQPAQWCDNKPREVLDENKGLQRAMHLGTIRKLQAPEFPIETLWSNWKYQISIQGRREVQCGGRRQDHSWRSCKALESQKKTQLTVAPSYLGFVCFLVLSQLCLFLSTLFFSFGSTLLWFQIPRWDPYGHVIWLYSYPISVKQIELTLWFNTFNFQRRRY